MGTISVQHVTKQFGGQVVLDDVSVELHSGETVGIVGPNGAGKTTLLRLIVGQISPDSGTVTVSRGMRIGYLPQEPEVGLDNMLHDEVLGVFAEVLAMEHRLQQLSEQMAEQHDSPRLAELMKQYDQVDARFHAAGGYAYEQRLEEILGGLGFSQADRSLPMAALSGGQKCRAALAKLLLQDTSYLLLDEPTNHLDIDAVRWLEKFLAGHHGGAAIISHDRYLLDRLADRIIEVERAGLRSCPGNYTNYVRVRRLRETTQQRQYEKDKALLEKEQEFIARHLAGQRTREAQGRRKRLQRRIEAGEFVLERPARQRDLKMDFNAPAPPGAGDARQRAGHVVIELDGLRKCYDDKLLFADLSLQLVAGRRLGITGPNGTGKTTLLRILLGEIAADAGRAVLDPYSTVGYFAQETHDLDAGGTPISEILAVRPDFSELAARNFLARFLFAGEDVFKPVGKLSGGEQSRLRLARLMLQAPQVLILDEPTNHLDIRAREALETALAAFPGTIVAVSHDRYFLDRIAQHLLVLRPGGHRLIAGNYSEYIRLTEEESRAAEPAGRPRRSGRTRQSAARGKPTRQRSRFERMSLEELEAFIMDAEARLAQLERDFADPTIYRDGTAVADKRAQFDAIKADLAQAESTWLERAEEG